MKLSIPTSLFMIQKNKEWTLVCSMQWDVNRFHCNSVVRRSSDGNEGLHILHSNDMLDIVLLNMNRKLTNSTKMAARALIYAKMNRMPKLTSSHGIRFNWTTNSSAQEQVILSYFNLNQHLSPTEKRNCEGNWMTPLLHQVSHHAIVLTRYWEGVKHLFLGAGHSRTTLPLPLTALLSWNLQRKVSFTANSET